MYTLCRVFCFESPAHLLLQLQSLGQDKHFFPILLSGSISYNWVASTREAIFYYVFDSLTLDAWLKLAFLTLKP